MAVQWGAWEYSSGNGMRVGIDVSVASGNGGAILHTTEGAVFTVKYYTQNQYTYGDNQTLSFGGAIDGGINFTNNDGGAAVLRATRTYTYMYPSGSYGSSPGTRTFNVRLSGAFNGVTPSVEVTERIPARPYDSPAAPTNVSVSRINDGSQKVTWTRHPTAGEPYDNIRIQRYNWTGDRTWVNWGYVDGSSSSWTDSGTVGNDHYVYRVRAENSAGNSGYNQSNDIWTSPAAPTNCVRTASGADQVITWQNNCDYGDFETEVWRSVDGVWSLLTTRGSAYETYTDSTAPAANKVAYRVRARTTQGERIYSSYSNTTSETAGVTSKPAVPTKLSPANNAVVDPSQAITFTWKHNPTDGTAQTAYSVRHRVVGAANWTTVAKTNSVNSSYTLPANTYQSGQTVEWQVQTWGSNATASDFSASAQFIAAIRTLIPAFIDLFTGRIEGKAGAGWQNVVFKNGWSNEDSGDPVQYRLDGNIVRFRGRLHGTTAATVAFTLPVGYRPDIPSGYPMFFPAIRTATDGLYRIKVEANGDVTVDQNGGAMSFISMSTVSFITAG